MNFVQLRNFIIIADTGSFTKAEDVLNTSKTALKRQVDTMEEELGVHLFIRASSGLKLTKCGELFYRKIADLIDDYDKIVSECQKIQITDYKPIKIGIYTITDMQRWYAEIQKNSEIKIQQVISSVATHEYNFNLLKEGTIDFLEYEDNEDIYRRGLLHKTIIADYLCCIVNPELEIATKTEIHMEDLSGYDVYCWTSNSSAIRSLYRLANEYNISLKGVPYSVDTILNICSAKGIYILSKNSAATFSPFKIIPITPEIQYSRGLVYQKDKEKLLEKMLNAANPYSRL